mmetsp:Transcript_76304/g.220442  ORF Transcript_76304/g.220442 Transcript_76304/m.220442 type:complete len:628 (+) Transcript_76304:76-1959(+)
MEAAQQVMERLALFGRHRGGEGLHAALAARFLSKGATFQALQLSVAPLAEARSFAVQAPASAPLPALPADLQALPETAASLRCISSAAALVTSRLPADARDALQDEALRSVEDLVASVQSLGHGPSEVAALSALASACASRGDVPRDAARAAARAVKVARTLQGKEALMSALETVISTSFAQKDADEALHAASELSALARDAGDRRAQARAVLAMARAQLASEEPKAASEAAQEAAELFKVAGDKGGQASALAVAYDVEVLLGKPAAAASRAREVLTLVRGNKQAEAVASLMLGSVDTASQDSLGACREACELFKGLGNRLGEAAALVATANAQLCQGAQSAEAGLASAQAALAIFRELASGHGEAAALAAAGAAHSLKGDAGEAEKAVKESLELFRGARDPVGESFATTLLKSVKAAGRGSKVAKLTIDEAHGLAHIELTDGASPASLKDIVARLQATAAAKCIVLHVEGAPPPGEPEHGTAMPRAYGTFLMGLRMIALPIICAITGKISGPMWTFVLACDYRFAATSTVFICPIWGKLECMGDLVGHNSATQLCLARGPKDSLVMLENGVVHQLQRGPEDTKKAASEMAKRIAATPAMACRKQPFVLNRAVGEYAMSAAYGKVVA